MEFVKPKQAEIFTISSAPDWPTIEFQTNATGSHVWTWTVTWDVFKESGTATTLDNRWDAKQAITNLGGTLSVTAKAAKEQASISVTVKGTNPTAIEVTQYLTTQPNSAGFEKIIAHENKYKHFTRKDEPAKSFDAGYGMCQLTKPRPSFAETWNWKLNVNGGLDLFGKKRTAAISYLSAQKRAYTTEQLKYETVSLWNGGYYHEWSAEAGAWVRKATITCDTGTGNIGWDMTKPENKGKPEAELRARDKGEYGAGRKDGALWGYYGVCYADRVLG